MADSKLAKWFIGAEIYALRSLIKISQVDLGRKLGYGYQTIASWERGIRVPKVSIIKDLCDMAKVEEARKQFLLFVAENHREPDIVANLDWRRISILEQAERTYGEVFKFENSYIPGPLQLQGYHEQVLPSSGPASARGWKQKSRRGLTLKFRKDNPVVQLVFGYDALRHLRRMTDWKRQTEELLEAAQRPNWEVLVIDDTHRGLRSGFDIYMPNDAPEAGPPFVYTESLDQSRHIEGSRELALYAEVRDEIRSIGTPIKEVFSDGIRLLA